MWARRTLPLLAVALVAAAGPGAAQVLAARLVVEEQDPPDAYELHDGSGALIEVTYSFLVRVPAASFCTGPIDVEFSPGELPPGMTLLVARDRVRLNYPQAQPNLAEARVSGIEAAARLFADGSTPSTAQVPVVVQARAVASPMETTGASCNVQASAWTPSTFYFDYEAPALVSAAQEPEAVPMELEPRLPTFVPTAATNSPAPVRALPFLVVAGLAAGLPAVLVAMGRRRADGPVTQSSGPGGPRVLGAFHRLVVAWLASRGPLDGDPGPEEEAGPRPAPK